MRKLFWTALLSFGAALSGCSSLSTKTYSYGADGKPADQMAFVSGDTKFEQGIIIIREIDGKDSRTHPLLQPYANSQALLAPQKVLVEPGDHTFGVLYVFIDALFDGDQSSLWWGKVLTSDLAKNATDKYAPDAKYAPENRDHVVTFKHFAEITFHCDAKAACEIEPVIDKAQAKVSFTVRECAAGGHKCTAITSSSGAEKTAVVPGYSYTDI